MITDEQNTYPDEEARCRFWTEYMDRGYELVQSMSKYEVKECGEGVVSIPEAAEKAGVKMLFSETKIAGDLDRIFIIRESLIPDLLAIARDMKERGWILKIEDGYRTREMQTQLGRKPEVFDMIVRSCWRENGGAPPPLDLVKKRSMCLVANYPYSGTHLMAAAVDISVFRIEDGSEVSRGKPYLEMSEYTPMDCPFISVEEHHNRMDITALMERHGFLHFPGEFWHYNKGDALYQIYKRSGEPGCYGPIHWDPQTGEITPFDDITSPLTPPDLLAGNLQQALKRMKLG
mgnify:CR=1 FL=1